MQPTLYALKFALTQAKRDVGTPGFPMALSSLRFLREKKMTWVGKEENELRHEIIGFLRLHDQSNEVHS